MLKIKKFILIFMLLVVSLSFSACATVRAMVVTNLDGSIDEFVTIQLDSSAISSAGENIQEVKTDIYLESLAVVEAMKESLNIKIFEQLESGVTEETTKILMSYKNGVEIIKSDWENNDFIIGVRFKNIDVYRYFYGINSKNKIEYKAEEHFLYTKMYYNAYTMYVRHSSLYSKMVDIFSEKYPDLVDSETNQLLYTYTTESRREHSNADYINKINGVYYHTWIVDGDNLQEPIMIYYNVAKAGIWIILSVIISLIILVVLLFIALIITLIKRKNRKLLKYNENIKNIQ